MELQRVGRDLVTEQRQQKWDIYGLVFIPISSTESKNLGWEMMGEIKVSFFMLMKYFWTVPR